MSKLPEGSLLNQLVQLINAGEYVNASILLNRSLEEEYENGYGNAINNVFY